MGIRLNFIKNNTKHTATDLFIEHYANFRNWYLAQEQQSLAEYNEAFGIKSVINFCSENSDLPKNLSMINDKLFNDLMGEFVVNAWDAQKDFFEFFGAMMNRSRYENNFPVIRATHDQDFILLWKYITQGRCFATLSPYQHSSHAMNVGFLDRDEYLRLQYKIEQYFGDINTLRSLNQTGLECMLQTLLVLSENNPQLISIIEK